MFPAKTIDMYTAKTFRPTGEKARLTDHEAANGDQERRRVPERICRVRILEKNQIL